MIKIDDEEAEDPGPMPQLEDMNPYLSALRAQLESADKEEAQLRAVRRQKDDALQAQKIYQARLAEEASKARDKELAASVAKSALLAEIERAKQGRGVVRSTAQYSRPRTLRSTCVVLRRYCGYKYINFYYLRWWGARAARSERWFARCRGAVESEGTRVVASILVATAALRTRRSDFFLVHFFCRLAAGTSLRRHGRFVVVEFQVFVRVSKQVLLFLHVVVNI